MVQTPRATNRGGLTYSRQRGREGRFGSRTDASQAASNTIRPQPQARVYAITRQEASAAPQVITGMVSFLNQEVCALIDPGATHSFVSSELAHKLQLQYEDMLFGLCVRTPLGENVIVDRECKGQDIVIGGNKLRVDLVVMHLQDFDLILGMDWLAEHRVTMNCFTREVIINSPGQPSVRFRGEK